MEAGYIKADSRNLPSVSDSMMYLYISKNTNWIQAETRGVKDSRSSKCDLYADLAIGYVQIKRENSICLVKARMCPEHKNRQTPYKITAEINEQEQEVLALKCEDCIAQNGGCKHSFAFLCWLNKRTSEKSCTSTVSYWKKPRLSNIEKNIQPAATLVNKKKTPNSLKKCRAPTDDDFFNKFLIKAGAVNIRSQIMLHYLQLPITRLLSMYNLIEKFKESSTVVTAATFADFCAKSLSLDNIKCVEAETRNQSSAPGWFHIKFGRITASRLYEISRCKTTNGSTVEKIFGARNASTEFMKRGLKLEPDVLKVVEKKLNVKIKQSGFMLSQKYPLFGVSPDGVTEEAVFEIKSPSSIKNIRLYLSPDGNLQPKVRAQLQLQMLICEKSKGFLCITSPNFEQDFGVELIECCIDEEFLSPVINDATQFWNDNIFPKLCG